MTETYKELCFDSKLSSRSEWLAAANRLQAGAEGCKAGGEWAECILLHCAAAECLLETSDLRRAHQTMLETQHLQQQHLPEDGRLSIHVLDVLGKTFAEYLGDYRKSQQLHSQALEMCCKVYGIHHVRTAHAHLSLAETCGNLLLDGKQLEHSQAALEIFVREYGGGYPLAAHCYMNLANCKWGGESNEESINNLKKADGIYQAYFGKEHHFVAQCRFFETNLYVVQKNGKAAVNCCQSAIDLNTRLFGHLNSFNQRAYTYLGAVYNSLGNMDDALVCFGKAREIGGHVLGENHIYLGECHFYLGKSLRDSGKTKEGIEHLKKAGEVFSQQYANSSRLGDMQRELAIAYEYAGDNGQAIDAYRKAVGCLEIAEDASQFQLAFTRLTFGRCLILANQMGEAEEQCLLGHEFLKKHRTQRPSMYHFSLNSLANCLCQQGEFGRGLAYVEEALGNLSLKHGSNIDFMLSMQLKMSLLAGRYGQTGNVQHLLDALGVYAEADHLIGEGRVAYNGKRALGALQKKARLVYETALHVICLLLGKDDLPEGHTAAGLLDLAFGSMEKCRAMLLYAGMMDVEARLAAQVPPETVGELDRLEKRMRNAEKRLGLARRKNIGQGDVGALEREHFAIFGRYRKLLKSLEQSHPDYHRLKYGAEGIDLPGLQAYLKENLPETAVLSYVVSRETGHVYVFYISGKGVSLHFRPLPEGFGGLLDDFRKSIDSFGKGEYLRTAWELHQLLVAPVRAEAESEGVRHLCLLPDEELHLLPFDALLTEKAAPGTAYPDLPYLLRDYDISHHYSAGLLHYLAQRNGSRPPGRGFAGFAPVYGQNGQGEKLPEGYAASATRSVRIGGRAYSALLYSEEEVRGIGRLFEDCGLGAAAYLHQEATKRNFEQVIGDSKYVLVAAHGFHNAENPSLSGIVFSPDVGEAALDSAHEGGDNAVLYFPDAYDLDLKADLVVLGSCESGIGGLEKGEGMINMNRGLLHAGAGNIIYTLFRVYDKASCELNVELFRQVLAGSSYRRALANAKRKLMRQRNVMPKFWAGYVLLGC